MLTGLPFLGFPPPAYSELFSLPPAQLQEFRGGRCQSATKLL